MVRFAHDCYIKWRAICHESDYNRTLSATLMLSHRPSLECARYFMWSSFFFVQLENLKTKTSQASKHSKRLVVHVAQNCSEKIEVYVSGEYLRAFYRRTNTPYRKLKRIYASAESLGATAYKKGRLFAWQGCEGFQIHCFLRMSRLSELSPVWVIAESCPSWLLQSFLLLRFELENGKFPLLAFLRKKMTHLRSGTPSVRFYIVWGDRSGLHNSIFHKTE